MAFALLSKCRTNTQCPVKPVPKRKSAHEQHSADLRFGFANSVFQPQAVALPTAPLTQTKLKVGEPNDKFEQEADRVADRVMKMPEALPPGSAIATSESLYPTSAIQSDRVECGRGGGPRPQRVKKETIESNTLTETITPLIQRERGGASEPNDQTSPKEENRKAELEFHSALHFNRGFSGFNPTREPKEGEGFIIWWSVWNTGWKTAPEHWNRLTIYKADLCSGCRYERDELFRSESPAPSIVSGTQQGKSEYESAVFVGMSLSAGLYDAYVDLDVRNEVDEINEDNNTAFISFFVRPDNKPESALAGEEATVRPKRDAGRAPDVGPNVESQMSALRSGGQPLPQSLRDFFEPRFGYDFTRVFVHDDAHAAAAAQSLQAKAFTVGHHIGFGVNNFAPDTLEGRRLLAHELTHVIQQTGKSLPVIQRKPDETCPKLVSFTASGKDPALTDKCPGGKCRFGLGCCETKRGQCGSGDKSGMVFKAVVKTGENCKGELAFMQNLLATNRKVTKSDGAEECLKIDKPHRDGGIPWKGCEVSVDSPGEFAIISDDCPYRELTDNPADVSLTDSFKTFLLWKSDGAKDRLPFANVNWGWGGKITRAKGKECGSQYKIISASHTDGEGKTSQDKPVTAPLLQDVKPGPCK